MNGKRYHTKKILMEKEGFSYVFVLIIIVVMGIAATSASRYWSTIAKREHEKELLFRGDQIRTAIISYYNSAPEGSEPSFPDKIEDLMKDNRYPFAKRHLRKYYIDPLTSDGEWGLILNSAGKIQGIFSKNKKKPLKTGKFKSVYKSFERADTYSDWKFVFQPKSSG